MNEVPIPKKDPASNPRSQPFSTETVQALQELGNVFRQIHRRLVSEGYIIRNGKIIKPGSDGAEHGAN